MLSKRCYWEDAKCQRLDARKDAPLAAFRKGAVGYATGKTSSERCSQKDAIGEASSLDAIGKVLSKRCSFIDAVEKVLLERCYRKDVFF